MGRGKIETAEARTLNILSQKRLLRHIVIRGNVHRTRIPDKRARGHLVFSLTTHFRILGKYELQIKRAR